MKQCWITLQVAIMGNTAVKEPKDDTEEFLKKAKSEFEIKVKNPREKKAEIQDFERIKTLYKAIGSRVFLVHHLESGEFYAMKMINKSKIIEQNQQSHVTYEKDLLHAVDFPFILKLVYSFQNNSHLFMVMEFTKGGELFWHLRKNGRFHEDLCRFYAAQIVLALEYLHYLGVGHRDLKPENVLLDQRGYVKLSNFRFAKKLYGKNFTLCGTPEYLAPEVINFQCYNKSVDWWCLGILIYELAAGFTPFRGENDLQIYNAINTFELLYPPHFSCELTDLLDHLIEKDLSKRYGNLKNGTADIKEHKWFGETNWRDIYERKVQPPFKPTVEGKFGLNNFNNYDEEPVIEAETNEEDEILDKF